MLFLRLKNIQDLIKDLAKETWHRIPFQQILIVWRSSVMIRLSRQKTLKKSFTCPMSEPASVEDCLMLVLAFVSPLSRGRASTLSSYHSCCFQMSIWIEQRIWIVVFVGGEGLSTVCPAGRVGQILPEISIILTFPYLMLAWCSFCTHLMNIL